MKYGHDPKPRRVAEPVQVYLDPPDRLRLEQLVVRLDTTKSDVLRRGIEALEQQLTDPASHPSLGIIGIAGGHPRRPSPGYDVAREHDRFLAESEASSWKAPRRESVAAELFVDTSAWFPLADPDDPAHAAVARELREAVAQRRRIVTTNLVLAETHALLMRRIHREAALAFLRGVRRPPHLVVSSTPDLELRAEREWLARYEDQDFSLADGVSFAVMAERGIRDALALDHHFAVAGFVVVPAGAK